MPRIVIVGAGPAGLNAMQTLAATLSPSDNTEVVVFEKSAFFYHTPGAPRAYTDATYANKMFVPYDNAIPEKAKGFVRIVRAVVTRLAANEVAYKTVDAYDQVSTDEESLSFDYLILAMGSTYTVPIKPDPSVLSRSHTEEKFREVREQIASADKVLIVGGGAVGCEVAGDIAAHFPEKHVTIVTGSATLVPGDSVKDSFRTKLLASLEALHVRVVLGERLEERLTGNVFEKQTLRTDKGTVIESDIQLLCAGYSPSSDLVEAMNASLIDGIGAIRVNDQLQLDHPSYAHIFALGDVTNHATPKMAYYAGEQAKHVANELAAVVRAKQTYKIKAFPPIGTQTLLVPLGPNGGVTQLPLFGGWILGDWTTRMIKSKDMMVGYAWGALNATMPQ